ncbi:hypothetical protein D9613_008224 [Agrocybe pediades]|uniref:DUF6533 domain-containing protein n=1 Tax=Agrocybe pediades TaxID=84607 RepID=A0A8H4VQJ7_9AGAR|nr:hypothetical protein D9613_008224 [Agrocybe pediades]
MADSMTLGSLISDLQQIRDIRYAKVLACTLVAYDHMCTFGREVELIWKGKWSPINVLVLLVSPRVYQFQTQLKWDRDIFQASLLYLGNFNIQPSFDTYGGSYLFKAVTYMMAAGSQFWNRFNDIAIVRDLFIGTNEGASGVELELCSCIDLTRSQMFSSFCSPMLAAAVLQTRVYALYGRDKRVLLVMITCYLATLSVTSWSLITDMVEATSTATEIPGGGMICPLPPLSKVTFGLWIPPITFELGLFLMVAYKGYQTSKHIKGSTGTAVTLMKTIIRDSVMYFLVLSILYAACLVVWLVEPVALIVIPASVEIAMSCILGGRMVFNLREAAIKQQTSSARSFIPLIALGRA